MDNICGASAFPVELNNGGSAHRGRSDSFTNSTTPPGDIVPRDGCNDVGGIRLCRNRDERRVGVCIIIRVATAEADKDLICKAIERQSQIVDNYQIFEDVLASMMHNAKGFRTDQYLEIRTSRPEKWRSFRRPRRFASALVLRIWASLRQYLRAKHFLEHVHHS